MTSTSMLRFNHQIDDKSEWLQNVRQINIDTAWNEAYIMLVSCIDYALDMTCIQSVSQCFIVGGIL